MSNERKMCFVLCSPRLPCGRRAKSSFEESEIIVDLPFGFPINNIISLSRKRPKYQEEKTNGKCN